MVSEYTHTCRTVDRSPALLSWLARSISVHLFQSIPEAAIKRLLILGSGPFAQEVADVAACGDEYTLAGFVENLDRGRCRERLNGLPILWVDDLAGLAPDHWAICSLGTTERWRFIEQAAAQGLRFATLAHPSVNLAPTSSIGEGTFLGPGVIVAAEARIGRHVRVNRGAMIGHHTTVGEYSTIQPGANIAGCCHIGVMTCVGIGAIVTERIRIGAHCMVCAGAVVTKDVPEGVQAAGRPAKGFRRRSLTLSPAIDATMKSSQPAE